MRYLILSDLHLGHSGSRAVDALSALAKLAPRYDRVILNGDTFDREHAFELPGGKTIHPQDLASLLGGRGHEALLLTGNHDPDISTQHYFFAEEPGFLAMHGDYIFMRSAPWGDIEKQMAGDVAARMAALPPTAHYFDRLHEFRAVQAHWGMKIIEQDRLRGRSALFYLLRQFLPPTRPFRVAWYVLNWPKLLMQAAQPLPVAPRVLAIGHTHRPGQWNFSGLRILNTGSHMPLSRPYAVEVEGTEVRLLPLRQLLERAPRIVPVTS
jgi:predicted phosphodiesterase